MTCLPEWVWLSEEVAQARAEGSAVVVMESSVWAQGLPRPLNLEVARETAGRVRELGVVPAISVLWDGKLRLGLSESELEQLCAAKQVSKAGIGEIPGLLLQGGLGATTVSASLWAADLAGFEVLATGGLGGVHLNWNTRLDISADLGQLSRTRCLTVCSGVKSVLDVPATVELLEALAVPLALYQTDVFPLFYTPGTPVGIGFRVEDPEQCAQAHRWARASLGRSLVVCRPCPQEAALESSTLEDWIRQGTERAESEGHIGKRLTPFLLDYLARASGGATLIANRALLVSNAELAARVARALNTLEAFDGPSH